MLNRASFVFSSIVAAVCLIASSAASADGRTEINQTSVLADGGFPFTIASSGNYVLTSDLVAPANVSAIELTVGRDVTIDLNGFRIKGAGSCSPFGCSSGSANGIDGQKEGDNIAVFGGEVSGFSGSCIALRTAARVERMRVSGCGVIGIDVAAGSLISNNIISDTAEEGIRMGEGSVFVNNTVITSDLRGTGALAIAGGTATGGNHCQDGTCSWFRASMRRFYLTVEEVNGAEAAEACAPGFHMASLFEIQDVGSLLYDTSLGFTRPDSGSGPPSSTTGRVRTGGGSSNAASGAGVSGQANCNAYTSTSGDGSGVFLKQGWGTSAGSAIWPYSPNSLGCGSDHPVWCVQN